MLYIGLNVWENLEDSLNSTFGSLLPVAIFAAVFPIVLGMFIRLPQSIKEMRSGKKWSVDGAKLLAIGLPAFLVALTPTLYVSPLGQFLQVIPATAKLLNSEVTTIAGLVFGYVLLDSISVTPHDGAV
jgi:hypothetical protein